MSEAGNNIEESGIDWMFYASGYCIGEFFQYNLTPFDTDQINLFLRWQMSDFFISSLLAQVLCSVIPKGSSYLREFEKDRGADFLEKYLFPVSGLIAGTLLTLFELGSNESLKYVDIRTYWAGILFFLFCKTLWTHSFAQNFAETE